MLTSFCHTAEQFSKGHAVEITHGHTVDFTRQILAQIAGKAQRDRGHDKMLQIGEQRAAGIQRKQNRAEPAYGGKVNF